MDSKDAFMNLSGAGAVSVDSKNSQTTIQTLSLGDIALHSA